jgi:C4-dicarboxylate-specific signal transduction histidine kinase
VGIIARAARSGESQLVNDVSRDPDYRKHNPITQSELTVPIKINSMVVGVINIERPDINGFQPEDQHALESLAAQASIALQNARQHEEINKTKEQLAIKTAIALMGIDSAESGHATLTDATTIRDLVALLNRDFHIEAAPDRTKGWLKRIDAIAARIQEKLGYISPSPEEGQQSVVVSDFVYEQLDQLRARLLYRHGTASVVELQQEIPLSGHYAIRANPRWLARVLNIIVDNALEAVAEIEKPIITIATKLMDGGVGIFVSDTGRGIPDNVRQQFLKQQVKPERGSKGLGMGVLLAQDIIQTYGGELRLGSTGPQGTTALSSLGIRVP